MTDPLRPPATDEEPWILRLEPARRSRHLSGIIAAVAFIAMAVGFLVAITRSAS